MKGTTEMGNLIEIQGLISCHPQALITILGYRKETRSYEGMNAWASVKNVASV